MQVPTQDQMMASIDAFLARHPKIGESRFGRDVSGEPGLVARLRRGSSPTLNMLEKISDFMAEKDREAGFDHVAANTAGTEGVSSGKTDDVSPRAAA